MGSLAVFGIWYIQTKILQFACLGIHFYWALELGREVIVFMWPSGPLL